MKRMGTLLSYALMIVVFMFLSYILEDGLIANMYKELSGGIVNTGSVIAIENVSARASNVSGYMKYFDLDGISVIEWADNIRDLLPPNTIYLTFTILEDGTREVEFVSCDTKFINELKTFYEREIRNEFDYAFSVPYTTFNVGIINGGSEINSVAEKCEILFDFRTISKNEEKFIGGRRK